MGYAPGSKIADLLETIKNERENTQFPETCNRIHALRDEEEGGPHMNEIVKDLTNKAVLFGEARGEAICFSRHFPEKV